MTKAEKKWSVGKIIGIILGLVGVVLVLIALRYLLAFNGFLDKITGGKEKKEYSVGVLEESEYESLGALAGKSFGFLKTDDKAGNAEEYLKNKVSFETSVYEDAYTLVEALSGKITEAIVIPTDILEALKDEAENFEDGEVDLEKILG